MRRSKLLVIAGLALGAVAAWGAWDAYERDTETARARLAGRSQTFQGSHGRIEYAVIGEGEPVLSVHGASGGFDQALDMTGELIHRGYQVIAPSRFGYLGSDAPTRHSPEVQADAYAELLDHLGVKTAAVVGISAGAWSSIQFAARHADKCRALALLVPADHLREGERIRGGPLVEAVFNSDFVAWAVLKATAIAPGLLSGPMLATDAELIRQASSAERARVRQVLDHLLPIAPRRPGMRFDIATAADRRPYPIRSIRCPVLAISAEDDGFGTAARARAIARAARAGKALIFPTGGHALVGRHDEALDAVSAFLASARA